MRAGPRAETGAVVDVNALEGIAYTVFEAQGAPERFGEAWFGGLVAAGEDLAGAVSCERHGEVAETERRFFRKLFDQRARGLVDGAVDAGLEGALRGALALAAQVGGRVEREIQTLGDGLCEVGARETERLVERDVGPAKHEDARVPLAHVETDAHALAVTLAAETS